MFELTGDKVELGPMNNWGVKLVFKGLLELTTDPESKSEVVCYPSCWNHSEYQLLRMIVLQMMVDRGIERIVANEELVIYLTRNGAADPRIGDWKTGPDAPFDPSAPCR